MGERPQKLRVLTYTNLLSIPHHLCFLTRHDDTQVTLTMTDDQAQIDMARTRPEDIDLRVLGTVHRTAGRSRRMMDELKQLKSKVYSLESDVRHL